jgi:hypothetical protein
MEIFTSGSGLKRFSKDKVLIYSKMEKSIKELLEMDLETDMENISILMEISTREIGLIIKKMAKELFYNFRFRKSMKDSL